MSAWLKCWATDWGMPRRLAAAGSWAAIAIVRAWRSVVLGIGLRAFVADVDRGERAPGHPGGDWMNRRPSLLAGVTGKVWEEARGMLSPGRSCSSVGQNMGCIGALLSIDFVSMGVLVIPAKLCTECF